MFIVIRLQLQSVVQAHALMVAAAQHSVVCLFVIVLQLGPESAVLMVRNTKWQKYIAIQKKENYR